MKGGTHESAEGEAPRSLPPQLVDIEKHQQLFEELGLGGREARMLTALLVAGSGTAASLSRLVNIAQPNAYIALGQLTARGLITLLPSKVAAWAAPGLDEVLARLFALQEEKLERAAAARDTLAAELRTSSVSNPPRVQQLRGVVANIAMYERLVGEVRSELLVVNPKPIYPESVSVDPAGVDPGVMAALQRGVAARALYPGDVLQGEASVVERYLATQKLYFDAGVEGRVTDSDCMAMAIFDQASVLFTIDEPGDPEASAETAVYIDHPVYARHQADLFEHYWATSRPFPGTVDGPIDDSEAGEEYQDLTGRPVRRAVTKRDQELSAR